METKHAIFLLGLLLAIAASRLYVRHHRWARDACAFLLLFGTAHADKVAVNFLSREWYRGTTRGIEVCWLDLLGVMLLLALPRPRRPRPLPASLGFMLLFVGYNALIVAFSDPALFGVFELSKMIRMVLLFYTVSRYVEGDHELVVFSWALCAAVSYEFISALRGRLVWGNSRCCGTLPHANSLSMYDLMAVPVLASVAASDAPSRLRRACSLCCLLGAGTVLLTISRNGVVTLSLLLVFIALVCGVFKNITLGKALTGLCVAAFLAGFVGLTYNDFKTRFENETLEKEYSGRIWEGRGVYLALAHIIVDDQTFGCGLNNWSWCVSNRYGPEVQQFYIPYMGTDAKPPMRRVMRHAHIDAQQAPPAHSLYAITLGETGWPGVVLIALMWIRWLFLGAHFLFVRSSSLRSRFGMGVLGSIIGASCQSFSEWEIRQTPLAIMLHILLGAAATAYAHRRGTGWIKA